MGLLVDVFRNADMFDCSNYGMSSEFDVLCLVNIEGPFGPDDLAVEAMLVKGNIDGTAKIVPCTLHDGVYLPNNTHMFGGNFASTCDERFHAAVRKITGGHYGAVPIHDRYEA